MNAMGLLSLPDFYRIKYGRGVEITSSVLMIFSFCILLAGNLVAGGFLFERFLGTSYAVGVLLIVAVVLTYTITGGMFSDAYTALHPDGHHGDRLVRAADLGGRAVRARRPRRASARSTSAS